MNPDIQVLIDAGLRPMHVASLIDVHRNSVTKWYEGGNPHRWITDRVHLLAQAVRQAMTDGKLPIPAEHMSRDEASHKTYATVLGYFQQGGGLV